MRYPTREYQSDQPSLLDDPASDHTLEDVFLIATCKRGRESFFLLTSVNHIKVLIAESLARGSEDNITVVAIASRKSFLQSALLRMGQALRRKTVK